MKGVHRLGFISTNLDTLEQMCCSGKKFVINMQQRNQHLKLFQIIFLLVGRVDTYNPYNSLNLQCYTFKLFFSDGLQISSHSYWTTPSSLILSYYSSSKKSWMHSQWDENLCFILSSSYFTKTLTRTLILILFQ